METEAPAYNYIGMESYNEEDFNLIEHLIEAYRRELPPNEIAS